MASLVFVRDSQRTPLMPMSYAYARLLLQRGKAQRIPHPTFMLLQLNYAIASPTLHPVVFEVTFTPRIIITVSVGNAVRLIPFIRLSTKNRCGHHRLALTKAIIIFLSLWLPISHISIDIHAYQASDQTYASRTHPNYLWIQRLQSLAGHSTPLPPHAHRNARERHNDAALTELPHFLVTQSWRTCHHYTSSGLSFHRTAFRRHAGNKTMLIIPASTSSQDAQ